MKRAHLGRATRCGETRGVKAMADSDLSPQEQQMISDGITIAGNAAGVAFAFAGIPGAGPLITAVGDLFFQGFAPAKNPAEAYYLALSRQIADMEATLLNKLLEINHQIQNLQTSLTILINEIGLQIDLKPSAKRHQSVLQRSG
jgi:hypothetical protein